MFLTYPQNCVIETCGVVIPSTAGVSCKESLMRPPVNKMFWTVTAAEEMKRDMICYYIVQTVQSSPVTLLQTGFPEREHKLNFLSISAMRKLFHLIWIFFSSQFEKSPICPFIDVLQWSMSSTIYIIKNVCHSLHMS